MLVGLDGHLVSTAFLETLLRTSSHPPASERAARTLREWRSPHAFGPASSTRTILDAGATPLAAALGFDAPSSLAQVNDALAATLRSNASTAGSPHDSAAGATAAAVALLVAPWGTRLDSLWRTAVTEALRRGAAWCLLFDGARLRVVDAGRLYARRFVEFDLDLALDHAASCAALWRSASAAALTAAVTDPHSLHALVAASDRHATGVCRSLRDGVVVASSDVLTALISRPAPGAAAAARRSADGAKAGFEQALTIVYRLLFLLFAEARALVPLWHPVYRDSYSVDALRELAERGGRAPGLWDTLRAMTRLAHAGCEAGDLRVTPFNGRLFSPARTPLAERRDLDDEAARRAVLALATRASPDRAGRERITYRDLGVEQLGAVYETLLDYEPRMRHAPDAHGRVARPVVTLEAGSGVRKATGTFYTPQPIADYLVRRTLGPLTRDARADQILQLRIVDPAMGSGAFLVAACRFLAHEYERALVHEGACAPGDLDEPARIVIRRTVAERCLYGVDLNPMAVQLARLSLWLATLAADRPLSFLDHRLQSGDSLLGAWLADLRHAPPALKRRTRDGGPLFAADAVEDALREALPVRFTLESTPNDSLEQVRLKERAFAAMTAHDAALSRWKRIAHLWCAAWFVDRDRSAPAAAFGSLSDFVLSGRSELPAHTASRYLEAADAVAEAKRFFHWELEYPEVFFDRDGRRLPNAGFDAVIGNPPWDMIRADAGPADRRERGRIEAGQVVRFTRESGIYSAQSDGHANRYQLFVERAMALTRAGGRLGLVLPSGLATDHGSASLRRRLLSACDVDAMVGIDNRRGVFPIHRSVRFVLVTASPGRATTRMACRLDLDDPAELERLGDEPADAADWFRVRLTPATIERCSGPDLAIPSLRDATDLAIVERAAALFPPLGSATGWSARFGRELNATDDRDAFRAAPRSPSAMPVFEGKQIEPFRITRAGLRHYIHARDAARLLPDRRYQRPRLGYRDVASATNRVTLIAALLPADCVSTHTVFCLRTPLPPRAQHFLCGLFNSLVVNFLIRLRVTTHVTTAVVERLPIPTAESAPAAFREIAALARVLARRDDPDAFARLNARVAELYQLSHDEFNRVLSTFPLIPVEHRARALEIFAAGQRTRR